MEYLALNTRGVRRVIREGRTYIVAPTTMIVPGVLPGSKGPLFYPRDEIQRNFKDWEGTPLVVGHPTRNGLPISASEVKDTHVGSVRNVRVKGKLQGESWVDIERLRTINKGLADAIERGDTIEVSTGLFTDNVLASPGSSYNGRPFTHIAKNYRPDHLAILPNQQGACSVQDGCGLNVNQLVTNFLLRNAWTEEARQASIEARRGKRGLKERFLSIKSGISDWVKSWESSNRVEPNPKLRKYKDRLLEQSRDFDNPYVAGFAKVGRLFGVTQAIEGIAGSRISHSSWLDRKTGHRYDFHPVEGHGVSDFVPGSIIETDLNGDKRVVKGPAYNLFKRNCQSAGGFLPKYIKKFVKMRRKENAMSQVRNVWSEEARKAALEARRMKGKPSSKPLPLVEEKSPVEEVAPSKKKKSRLKKAAVILGTAIASALAVAGARKIGQSNMARDAYIGMKMAKGLASAMKKDMASRRVTNAWSEAARKAAIEARKRKSATSGKVESQSEDKSLSDLDKPTWETSTPKKIARAIVGAIIGGATGSPLGPEGVAAGGVTGAIAGWKTSPKGPTKRELLASAKEIEREVLASAKEIEKDKDKRKSTKPNKEKK